MPELQGVSHRYVDAGGLRMHVAEAGQGDAVLLLHGWPQNWYAWRHQIPGLAERFRVIAPDLRGHGWTAAPPTGYDKEQFATDLLALLDALGIERVKLVGHDWGGFAGFLMCLREPDRVERYLCTNSLGPWSPGIPWVIANFWRFWYQVALSSPLGERGVRDSARLARALRKSGIARQDAWDSDAEEVFMAQWRESDRARAAVQIYRTFQLREQPKILRGRYRDRRVRPPVYFLHGTEDPVITRTLVEATMERCDEADAEWVSGVGHFIAEEAPDVVLDRALSFLTT